MTTIIVVTNNEKKCKELHNLLQDPSITVQTYSHALGKQIEIEETGSTFEANAILKVQAIANLNKFNDCIILADDSGIEVEALNNEPGIYSARYGGPGLSDDDRCNYMLDQLKDKSNRKARFQCVIAAKFPSEGIHCFAGQVEGKVAASKQGEVGFGYDPLFIPSGYDESFAELDPSIKSQISHRARALSKFATYLNRK